MSEDVAIRIAQALESIAKSLARLASNSTGSLHATDLEEASPGARRGRKK